MSLEGQTARQAGDAVEVASLPPSLAFLVRHGMSPLVLAEAGRIAAETGTGADVALVRSGLLAEEALYGALAAELDLPFSAGPLAVHLLARFPDAALRGVLPLAGESMGFALAPQGADFDDLLAKGRTLSRGILVTTPSALTRDLLVARGPSVAALAADGLARLDPDASYRDGPSTRQLRLTVLVALALAVAFLLDPATTWSVTSSLGGLAFLGLSAIRIAASLERVPTAPPPIPRALDVELPVYTLLVPVYRETRVLPKLIAALSALDYPAAKLDVKLLVEARDAEMRDAVTRLPIPAFINVVIVPDGAPRTKPRALNVGLHLARGSLVAVYDAEDVPDPGQLRLAAATFRDAPPDIGCLQARLVIDNTTDTWLTRFFTIEYAALFDVVNPALARFDLPIPLGGTSNHFRADVLKRLGGWDAWNVTEDADLGLRLAKAGYRVADLPSATLEEGTRTVWAWLRQRTRWMKGFLQVAITHSRHPARDMRRLGCVRGLAAMALSLGTVVSAFVYPAFCTLAAYDLATGRLLLAVTPGEVAASAIGSTVFAAGFLSMLLPPAAALVRRRWFGLLPLLPLLPFYYGLVSVGAWLGTLELLVDPDRWNKTEHGLAATSRAARQPAG